MSLCGRRSMLCKACQVQNDFGLMKLEIESEKIDNADDFKPKKHIKGVRLHFIPESIKGKQPLYNNIQFEKEKRHKED